MYLRGSLISHHGSNLCLNAFHERRPTTFQVQTRRKFFLFFHHSSLSCVWNLLAQWFAIGPFPGPRKSVWTKVGAVCFESKVEQNSWSQFLVWCFTDYTKLVSYPRSACRSWKLGHDLQSKANFTFQSRRKYQRERGYIRVPVWKS